VNAFHELLAGCHFRVLKEKCVPQSAFVLLAVHSKRPLETQSPLDLLFHHGAIKLTYDVKILGNKPVALRTVKDSVLG